MSKKCNHGVTSNTGEVFRTFIGCCVKGMVKEDRKLTYTLVFECGWGLTFHLVKGSHWTTSPDEVKQMESWDLYRPLTSSNTIKDTYAALEAYVKGGGQ